MGVPALFRWLTKKYPKIQSPVVEEQPQEINGVTYPVDTTKANPNGDEMHNLYLDFNGIVHPCSHPENKPPPANESEMMMEIFKYTDRVVNMVRPRRLLLIAVDGVAPRAKMNQQRARRFRAARDAKEADEKKAEFQMLIRQQQQQAGEQEETVEGVIQKTWDSNVITPGTPFMFILAQSIRFWCQWKLNTDPAWAQLKVIISDASVPGEGEHKIMQFIRSQRSDPEYDPNTRHVMYGLDADLIMLGIATHEPHFRILREDVSIRDAKAKHCKLCGQEGHYAENCRGIAKAKTGEFGEKAKTPELKPFIWLHVPVLREYLSAEMFVPGQTFRFDLERALDDWVFMCFFVGNDFLPHLPSLDIHEDGIDKLIAIWRDNVPIMGGYLTCDGTVDLARAQVILQGLAKQEAAIFKRRRETDLRRERNQKRRDQQDQGRNGRDNEHANKRRRSSPDYSKGGKADNRALPAPVSTMNLSDLKVEVDYNMIVNRGAVDKALTANKSAAAVLKAQMLGKQSGSTQPPVQESNTSSDGPTTPSVLGKRVASSMEDTNGSTPETPGRSTPLGEAPVNKNNADPNDMPPDTVKLWEEGYEERYYEQKFHVKPDDHEFRHQVARAYVEGLSWVLLYYYQGCPSWTWYYPFHYAPFAADFVDIEKTQVVFQKGKPFKPYEQLMGVLPAASNHAIPKAFHPLMTDEDSPIIDFYPEDFDLDLNGKKQSWKAVVLLPFIDEKRLLDAMATRYPELSEDEVMRNELGSDALIMSDQHPLYEDITMAFYSKKAKSDSIKLATRKGKLAGSASKTNDFLPGLDLRPPEEDIVLEPAVDNNTAIVVNFAMPASSHVHKSMLLPGVELPKPVLNNGDLAQLKSRSRTSGRDFGGAPLYDNTRRDPMDNYHNNRGGRINYAADRPPLPPQITSRDNPFDSFLDSKYAPGMPTHFPPPPPPPSAQQHYRPGQDNYYRQDHQYQGNSYQQNGYAPNTYQPPAHGGYYNQGHQYNQNYDQGRGYENGGRDHGGPQGRNQGRDYGWNGYQGNYNQNNQNNQNNYGQGNYGRR